MRGIVVGTVLLAVVGCAEVPSGPQVAQPAGGPESLKLAPVPFEDLPGWRGDTAAAVIPALLRSCDRLVKLPPDKSIGAEGLGGTASDWLAPCGAARRLPANDDGAARAFFEQWFSPWATSASGKAEGLFTGYFEAEVNGATKPQGHYTIPLLARPSDLVTADLGRLRPDLGHDQLAGRVSAGRLEPYPTRLEIERGALGKLAQPLFWLDDPVDAHILHIQGSGRVRLDDGRTIRVGVAATNGQKFVGLGKLLADRGVTEVTGSMPAIRAWLKGHPADAPAIMAGNPRYVFYRIVEGDGPIGAQGVPLTPERSLAVDPKYVPLGVPLWLDTLAPTGAALRRLMMAQDTGAAIKGPIRGDIFWGSGEAAFEQAGRMKSTGRYWLLLPRQRSPRLARD